MAERRMFALKIIDSDAFLDMPKSSQALYFHLSMRADDDGFISNPKKIMRMIGSSDDDMKILLSKRFLLSFDTGIVVIKHWRLHNYIAKDRYTETIYKEEKEKLFVKLNGAYTDHPELVSIPYTGCTQNDYTGKGSEDKGSLGKGSEGKGSEGKGSELSKSQKHKYGEYNHVLLTDEEHQRLLNEWGEQELLRMVKVLDEGMELKRYKYGNCNLAIRKWRTNEIKGNAGYSKPELKVNQRTTMLDLEE
jgi:hypothetical protein